MSHTNGVASTQQHNLNASWIEDEIIKYWAGRVAYGTVILKNEITFCRVFKTTRFLPTQHFLTVVREIFFSALEQE